jgi:predicted negative regulator of RcsB-dependent stress response
MKKTTLVKRWLEDTEKYVNQQERESIQQSEWTARKLLYWMATRAIFVIIAVLAAVGLIRWNNRDESQINMVFHESFQVARLAVIDGERFENIEAWLRTVVISGKSDGALKAARAIVDANLRSRAIVNIVEALAKTGKTDEALRAANEAFEAARKIVDAYFRSQAMVNIVVALANTGKTDEAFEAARKIEGAEYRSQAMASVAEAMIKNREAGKANSALNEAQRAAQQATKASEKSTQLAAVAIGLAKLHHYRLARETADLCTSPGNKLAAYTAILREYLIKRNPDLEKLFEEDMQE